ncbi:hypothetical protein SUGI_0717310 [Cryptomeria japonica]|nr:hypothetical protein SUGI_0717310 [Cryptomeria japonica]
MILIDITNQSITHEECDIDQTLVDNNGYAISDVGNMEAMIKDYTNDGSNWDHPISNPFGSSALDLKELARPTLLVIMGGCDLLQDREIEYAEKLKEYGKQVELVVYEGEEHGFFMLTSNSSTSKDLMDRIIGFMKAHQ